MGVKTLSFKFTITAYGDNVAPGYMDAYVSGLPYANYQLNTEGATPWDANEICYQSGSTIVLDLEALGEFGDFADGVKFILVNTSAWSADAQPSYITLEYQF